LKTFDTNQEAQNCANLAIHEVVNKTGTGRLVEGVLMLKVTNIKLI
jgi:hypothetical protein